MKKKIIKSLAISKARQLIKAKRRLLASAQENKENLFIQYKNNFAGYDEQTVLEMRQEHGSNEISHKEGPYVLTRISDSFINPFTVVLFALSVVSLFTDVFLAEPGQKDYSAVIIIVIMVLISGMLRFIQEIRSDKAAQKLHEMVETTISVQRKEGRNEIPIKELVVGDIIYLSAGDMVPADGRVLFAKDLFISQSSLTGESEPVEKFSNPLSQKTKNPLDLNNLVFMGSNVISGSAVAIIMATGDNTVFGSISQQISGKKKPTSFEKGVNSVSWVLIRFMLIMVPIVFFVNGFTKGNWVESLMFALSVAVGLTPEMLPMIVTTNLAKGAISMSKKKVIVKNLNSIQNFGAMDILCTDKTGTITQDKVALIYSLDIHGNKDERILRHALLNSYYQTGLKNLMDVAIINYAKEHAINPFIENYKKVDEIPFDFNRRRMSVVVEDGSGKTQLITKGAIEEMLSACSYVEYQGKVEPITEDLKQEIRQTSEKYNEDGMRVLAIAQKTNPSPAGAFSVEDESQMVMMGYLAFLDPPKDSSAEAIKTLHDYGVEVKVLTGDNDSVTRCVCKQVGMNVDKILLGSDIEEMSGAELNAAVEKCNVFAKLSPQQKTRVVSALRANGHTVGFMGDGINDAAAMKEADVGISVDSAVDIAKESANIILLEKNLMVLEEGVIEGRKTYANTIKYIKMTASSNFGNMFSVLAASAFLPFLPMLPIQILILNLIYDTSCTSIPWDNVDRDYLKTPRRWDAGSISKFMLWLGPTSSVFDILTYIVMFFVICPLVAGGPFHTLGAEAQVIFIALFHTGWFVESLWSQTLVIYMLRTPHIPFIQSNASLAVITLTSLGIIAGTVIPYTVLGKWLDMHPLPFVYFPFLIAVILLYMTLTTSVKKLFIRKYGELL
ncbi:Magnesium-translocating ATPase [Elusimicrobium minutum Pei191]|uniref:Magnesium-transporting ATPase, P-type 1 n=1 Tax=Elusimicrobium minutum (strain Pei191) TaxID=445932 RepID=B2KDL6_ELUMP|nr:magnesium-translocating P-type ATPase [Elusimicrobium minutum]ACC98612.1 Magnesium-translocating ATPase [Elusimicrobium minutum Pei191]